MLRLASIIAGLLWLFSLSGCGSNRRLLSVQLSPSSADAQNFPNGQIPFFAVGMYSRPPSSVNLTSNDVVWCAGTTNGLCVGNVNPGVTVDQSGIAQCNSGFVGTATLLAGTPSKTMVNPDEGIQLKIYGTAQITCP
jgi:hypothetical protein